MTERQNNQARPIDPCGVDENGTLCHWTGFDKTADQIYGRPVDSKLSNQTPPKKP